MFRVGRALSVAIGAVLLISGTVNADTTTGQTGHFMFTDAMATPGAKCTYNIASNDEAWLHKFTVKPPSLWWPDTSSSSNTEHGRVGWRFVVQYNSGSGWLDAKQSPVQKATAYEDSQNLYGNGTKAPLTKMSVTINAHNYPYSNWQVLVKGYWYKPNGSVLGSATHTVAWYRTVAGSSVQTNNSGCVTAG